MNLRRREPHAFVNYRNSITAAIQICEESARAGSSVKDLYGDIIRPQLDALETKDVEEKRRRRNSLATRSALGMFAAGFGALVSGKHPEVGAAIAAAIACLNPSAVEDIVGSVQSSPTVRSDGLYFLLEARKTVVG